MADGSDGVKSAGGRLLGVAQAHTHGHTVDVPYTNTPTMLRREGARFVLG